MQGSNIVRSAVALSVIATGAIGVSVAQAPNTVTKARYWMDAETVSGMMAAGANPMAMLSGRGGDAMTRNLSLRLGSIQSPAGGAAKADHFMPPVAALGASVPLLNERLTGPAESTPFERPKGRLRIFWGCGAKAGPGQPVVIDFAKMAAGQVPPDLYATNIPNEIGPLASNSRTFGKWPATRPGERPKSLNSRSSLIGAHRIAANYAPEIKFDLAQDFMAPLRARGADGTGGSVNLSWGAVPSATGYYAHAMGSPGSSAQNIDVVWWTSSATRAFGGGLADWLSPATVSRLIGQKIVMPPTQLTCTIPAEAKAAAGENMITFLTAYGPEANFSFPPRPQNATPAWRPEWTAKARFRSTTMVIPGMEAMMGGDDNDEAAAANGEAPKKKCKKRRGLGGMLGSALGVPTDC